MQKYMCQKLWHKPKGDDSLRMAKMKSKMQNDIFRFVFAKINYEVALT